MNTINSLERLLVVQACTDLIHRFADRIDARDTDALAAMFVEDAVFARPTAPDKPIVGRETIRAQFAARPAGKLTRHICANTIVNVLSPSEATAKSLILLSTATLSDDAVLPVEADAKQLLGAYEDRIVRDSDGVWKFKERRGSLAMNVGG